ncbi:MAG: AMP-binding protein, partial [Blautia sp.]
CENTEVMLLNEKNELVTGDEQGEICVRGCSLALGYYNNPVKTEEVFVQNPLQTKYKELIYRTGDIGRYNQYGEIVFCARKDAQIKHMGHRIELGEIEAAMDKVPEIVRSCCIFDTVKSKIVAFYEGDIERRLLAKALGQYVPAFMVPNVFRQVERMPLTKNGKIDRKALTAMYQEEKK